MTGRAGALAAALAAAAFAAWTALAGWGALDGLDGLAARGVDATVVPAGVHVLSAVSLVASVPVAVLWTAGLVVAAVLRPSWRPLVAAAVAALLAADLAELALKLTLARTPPHARTDRWLPWSPSVGGRGGSYPSGHMARAAVLAVATAMLTAPRRRRAALGWAAALLALVAWTRLYLAEHWLSDVVGGTLLGLAALAVAVAAVQAVRARARRRRATA